MNNLGNSVAKLTQKAQLLVKRTTDRHLKLAVTGLAGAGKTAFITGLVYQLTEANFNKQLPLWQVCREGRLKGIRRVMQPDLNIASFDYGGAMGSLISSPPKWPASTTNISELRLAIKYKPKQGVFSYLTDNVTLYLDIVDYPGEWLLDLPLLRQTFAQWCIQQANRISLLSQSPLYSPYIKALQGLDLEKTANEDELKAIAKLYQALINDLVYKQGYYFVQPGRMLLPGELKDTPLLAFFPILNSDLESFERLNKSPANSNYRVLQHRYQQYLAKVVKPFYREYFAGFDRQLVLVDCLSALNKGKAQFDDMKNALSQILESFQFGKNGWIRRLLSPKIDKLLIAASKIDHITLNQQTNLLSLLTNMLKTSKDNASFDNCQVETMAISALAATKPGIVETSNEKVEVVTGKSLQSNELITLYPGEVPAELPNTDFWQKQGFDFCTFAPPERDRNHTEYQHIRLDHLLEFLLGDKLR